MFVKSILFVFLPVPSAAPQNMTAEVLNSKVSRSQLAKKKKREQNKASQAKDALDETCAASVSAPHLLVRSNCTEQHICARLQGCHKALVPQSLFLLSPLLPPAQAVYQNSWYFLSVHRESSASCHKGGLRVYLRCGLHISKSPEYVLTRTSAHAKLKSARLFEVPVQTRAFA